MARIPIPEPLRAKLGAEHKMDVHWVDLRLRSGGKRYRLVVRGGMYLTGYQGDPDGEGDLDFESGDIMDLRPAALVRWWPFW